MMTAVRYCVISLVIFHSLLSPAWSQSNDETRGLTLVPQEPEPLTGEETDAPTLETPPLPEDAVFPALPEDYQRNVTGPRIRVNEIILTGNSVLPQSTIDDVTGEFVGRDLAYEDLQTIRNRLTGAYIERGYISSGVILPDQEIVAGVVRMDAHEGTLDEILISGNQRLRDRFIESRIQARLGPVLNVFELENALRLVQQWPSIRQVNAEVVPGPAKASSNLDLKVRENPAITLAAGYNNHRAPSVGEDQAVFSLTHQSLTGNGDYLIANYALTEGLNDLYLAYGIPLTARDLTLEGHYSDGESDIVESPFELLDIVTETENWGVKLYQPLFQTLTQKLTLGVAFEHSENESFLLGERFSFSPGESLGVSEVSVIRATADWLWRRTAGTLLLNGQLSFGTDWLDATDNSNATDTDGNPIEDLPDSQFTAALLQAQYARLLPWFGLQINGRLTGQWADDPLLSVEKLAIGGARTVRGFRENQLVRDKGIIANLELRIPAWADDSGTSRLGLTFVPFVDYGNGKDNSIGLPGLDDPQSESLLSAGAGLIWNYWSPVYVEVYYGADLSGPENSGDSLQDDGFHVLTVLQWQF